MEPVAHRGPPRRRMRHASKRPSARGLLVVTFWIAAARAADGTVADCPVHPDLGTFAHQLGELESTWSALDEPGFLKNADQVRFLLPCLAERLSPEVAARTHRAFALDAWVRGDERDGVKDLAAALTVDPSWSPPP